jgi:hypothetical protein
VKPRIKSEAGRFVKTPSRGRRSPGACRRRHRTGISPFRR